MLGDLVAYLKVDNRQWSSGLKQSSGQMKAFAGTVTTSVTGLAKAFGPLIAAAGAYFGVTKSLAAYKVQFEAEKKLAAVLKATENAVGLTQEQIQSYAGELQGLTNFGDEATIGVAAFVSSLKTIRGDEFKRTLAAAQDMAAVLGGDMAAHAKTVGIALQDPIKGMSKLAEAGVTFTEAETKAVAAMQEAGDLAGAQQVILGKLEGQFGGAAKALVDPWTQAMNVIGDVSEMVGSLLKPSLDVIGGLLRDIGSGLTSNAQSWKDWGTEAAVWLQAALDVGRMALESLITYLQPVTDAFTQAFNYLSGMIGDFFEFVGFSGSWEDFALDALTAFAHLGSLIEIAQGKFTLFMVQILEDAKHTLTVGLPSYLTWLADNWQEIFFTMADYALTAMINLGTNLRMLWQAVVDFIRGNPINLDFKPLLEGASSAIAQLPSIPERIQTDFEKSLQEDIERLSASTGSAMKATRKQIQEDMRKTREGFRQEAPKFAGLDGELPSDSSKGKFAGAQLQGSAEAFSTIVQAMRRDSDPQVKAINNLGATIKKEVGQPLKQLAGKTETVIESFG